MAQQLDDDNRGNVLGERVTFVYTANDGGIYNITQDATVGVACGNALSTDASRDLIAIRTTRPFRPRYVLLEGQSEPEKKKKVIIGSASNPLVTGAQTTVSINAVTFRVTFVGAEQRRIPRVQEVAAPAV